MMDDGSSYSCKSARVVNVGVCSTTTMIITVIVRMHQIRATIRVRDARRGQAIIPIMARVFRKSGAVRQCKQIQGTDDWLSAESGRQSTSQRRERGCTSLAPMLSRPALRVHSPFSVCVGGHPSNPSSRDPHLSDGFSSHQPCFWASPACSLECDATSTPGIK